MRKSNMELLRVIAMLMIIGVHYFAYVGLESISGSGNHWFYIIMESICIIGVNLFVLISGWFLIQKNSVNIRKAVDLLIQVAFWGGLDMY